MATNRGLKTGTGSPSFYTTVPSKDARPRNAVLQETQNQTFSYRGVCIASQRDESPRDSGGHQYGATPNQSNQNWLDDLTMNIG